MTSEKFLSLEQACELLCSSSKVVTAMAASEPRGFFSKLHEVAAGLEGVYVQCANPSIAYPCFTQNELRGRLNMEVMFLTPAIRNGQGGDRIHYIPQHLSQWVQNMRLHEPVDIFWGSCSLPDEHGYVSLGPSCCYESEVLEMAKVVVLEVNEHIPFVLGAPVVHIQQVDHFVKVDHELPTVVHPKAGSLDHQVAQHIGGLVEDGATLQLGIGRIPDAIASVLKSKKDLGVHTEMINDAMVDLYECGAITGLRKSIWPGKIVGSFAYGSRRLYDFLHQNPGVELHPSSVINDPYRIGRNHKMISINTAVEIDLTGQVCSESVGHRELSGVGGAAETHVGAQRSAGGRGIIALTSQGIGKSGEFSKIVFELRPGAKVSISRNDIDTVVTEYGVASLKGKSVAERVRDLIALAHPKYRDELTHQARKERYL